MHLIVHHKEQCARHIFISRSLSLSQIAYLENLLKMYNDEIRRLQEKELSVNELEEEDSSYIQEHKLKRKVRSPRLIGSNGSVGWSVTLVTPELWV